MYVFSYIGLEIVGQSNTHKNASSGHASQEHQKSNPLTVSGDCEQMVESRNHLAMNLAKVTRERKRKELSAKSNSTSKIPISLDNGEDLSTEDEKVWIERFQLYEHDKSILTTPGQWLNASIIDTAQTLLATQFKSIFGFQSVECGLAMTFAVEQRPYVQVLHDNTQKHWLIISNIGAEDPTSILIYDSLFHQCSPHVQQQIATITRTKSSEINVHFVDVQRQSGGGDCGLFAIAFATSICFGTHPETKFYCQAKMRQHLMKCIEEGVMTEFPVQRTRRCTAKIKNKQVIKVYCVCRMPRMALEAMIACNQCKEWFHGDICIQVCNKAWERSTKWLCDKCSV